MSVCHNIKFSNPFIFSTWRWKPLIFQTLIIWSNRIQSLKYSRPMDHKYREWTLDFCGKTQFKNWRLCFHDFWACLNKIYILCKHILCKSSCLFNINLSSSVLLAYPRFSTEGLLNLCPSFSRTRVFSSIYDRTKLVKI